MRGRPRGAFCALILRFRLCLRPTGSQTDTATSTEGDEDLWAWYDRDCDSLHFAPGFFSPSVRSPPDEGGSSEGSSQLGAAGSFARRGHEGQEHCWDIADSSAVQVRGREYLLNGRKEPSRGAMLELVHVDMFTTGSEALHYASDPRGAIQHLRRAGDSRFFFVLNFRIPPLQLAIIWAVPPGAEWLAQPEGALFLKFCNGMDDETRGSYLKLLPKVAAGPWLVMKAAPPRPVLIGRQCPITFFPCGDHFEASIDCGPSSIGKRLAKLLTDGSCDLELFGLLEGKAEAELPERVLGGAAILKGQSGRLSAR